MAGIIEIALSNLSFYSHHGLYAEEAKTGASFEVDLVIQHDVGDETITSINDAIDYVLVYDIVKQQMEERKALLETTAMKMAQVLKDKWPRILFVRVSIKKIAPPITGFIGNISVSYEYVF